jgi:hypothetical protein
MIFYLSCLDIKWISNPPIPWDVWVIMKKNRPSWTLINIMNFGTMNFDIVEVEGKFCRDLFALCWKLVIWFCCCRIRLRLMTMLRSRKIRIFINRDPRTVYEFILNLENLPRRTSMDFRSIKQKLNNEWIAETIHL